MAPLFEEIFFRGFMFEGFRHTRLGAAGAVVVTALAWASIHIQYDAYQIAVIFVGGLLLGTARLHSGSVYLTMAMHSLQNIIATIEAAVYGNRTREPFLTGRLGCRVWGASKPIATEDGHGTIGCDYGAALGRAAATI